jgi:phage shock protein PspC (stress-responsive transcriptional regulator)
MLGGVCGGLAQYSGIDALLWRVGFVALALAGGSGVVVYLLLWLLMPAAPGGHAAVSELEGKLPGRRPAAPRSPLPRITLAGLLIVVGLLVLISRITGWDPGARGFLGAALLVVGLGLVAVAFTGGRRARGGLIALGVVLSLALIAASTAPWGFQGGVGDRAYRPATAADVQPLYDAGVGDLMVDLTAVDLATLTAPVHTEVQHGVGDLHVLVPRSADVRIDVHQGMGDVDVFGQSSNSGFFPGTGSAAWTGDGRPEFVITVDAGVGDVEVSRA